MKYAPIVIPTLCRDAHLARALESLARNAWAGFTDVYIALDYPPSATYEVAYQRVCRYLETFDGGCFKTFTVIKRERNYGPGANALDVLKNVIVPRYDRWIISEDDIEFAPCFIEYMDTCLDAYESDERILAVCGYSYPLDWSRSDTSTVFLTQATYSAWGTGQWREKSLATWKALSMDRYLLNNAGRAFETGLVDQMIAGRRTEYVAYVTLGMGTEVMEAVTDMALGPYLTLSGKWVVVPMLSKTRNNGFDGSGLNCSSIGDPRGRHSMDYDYRHQPIDQSDSFTLVEESSGRCIGANKNLLDGFLFVPPRKKRLAAIGEFIYRHFGMRGCAAGRRIYLAVRSLYRGIRRK